MSEGHIVTKECEECWGTGICGWGFNEYWCLDCRGTGKIEVEGTIENEPRSKN